MAGPTNNQIVVGALAILAIGAALAGSGTGSAPPSTADAGANLALSADAVATCRSLLDKGMKAGIIRGRPAPNRIDVEDSAWRELDARTKEVTLGAVACDVWGRTAPPADEYVVAYGYRSGKRIDMLTASGIERE
ncbi:MAG: hypothetical protein EBR82_29435 [Caulobacteraceae bacterium]|nr:hypothetical protein [Caulobacteraceae bacterium]